MAEILIVEDESKLAQAMASGLRREGYSADVAPDAESGLRLVGSLCPDLVILDLMLPGANGLSLLRVLRRSQRPMPVLIVSARDRLDDRVAGLDLGADDYLVKPFAFAELVARVRALLRRGSAESAVTLTVADITLDLHRRVVQRAGSLVELTAREFELLEYLVRHRDLTVSREMLARDVWHVVNRATPLDNVIEVHMARLRRKVDVPPLPRLIHTVRGAGYCLSEREP